MEETLEGRQQRLRWRRLGESHSPHLDHWPPIAELLDSLVLQLRPDNCLGTAPGEDKADDDAVLGALLQLLHKLLHGVHGRQSYV